MAAQVNGPFSLPLGNIKNGVDSDDPQLYGTTPPESPVHRIRVLMQSLPSPRIEEGMKECREIIGRRIESGESAMISFSQLIQTFRRPIEEIDGFPANEEFFRCSLQSFTEEEFFAGKVVPMLMKKGEHPSSDKEIARFNHDVEIKKINKNVDAYRNNVFVYFSYISYFREHPEQFDAGMLSPRELREIFVCAAHRCLKAKIAAALIKRVLEAEAYPNPPLSKTEIEATSLHDYPIPSGILTELISYCTCTPQEIKRLFKRVHPSYLFSPHHLYQLEKASGLKTEEFTALLSQVLAEMPREYFIKWIKHEEKEKIQEMAGQWMRWSQDGDAFAGRLKDLLVVIEALRPNVCHFSNRWLSNYVALTRFFEECEEAGFSGDAEISRLKAETLGKNCCRLFTLKDFQLFPLPSGEGFGCKGGFMSFFYHFVSNGKPTVIINALDPEVLLVLYRVKFFSNFKHLALHALERQNRF